VRASKQDCVLRHLPACLPTKQTPKKTWDNGRKGGMQFLSPPGKKKLKGTLLLSSSFFFDTAAVAFGH